MSTISPSPPRWPRARVYLRISPAANGDQYEIDTPRGAVHIVRAGDYEVIAGDQDHPTTVMAFNGGVAEIVGPGVDAPVNSQQAVYISGQDQFQVNQGNAQTDDFITVRPGAGAALSEPECRPGAETTSRRR